MKEKGAILSARKCGDLFSQDPLKMREEYHTYVKRYHPDTNSEPDAGEVFKHIQLLYDKACCLQAKGLWETSNHVELRMRDGRRIQLDYLAADDFELGKTYIGRGWIYYCFDRDRKKFYDNARWRIEELWYEDEAMKKEIGRYMPKLAECGETENGRWVLGIRKNAEDYMLAHLLEYLSILPEKHVAWIVSGLLNICCYLEYIGLSYNGICLENCFISPRDHSIKLYGGWWYAVPQGLPMIGTVKSVYDVMPLKVKSGKRGHIQTDLESVKALAKRLLGRGYPDIVIPLREWLESGDRSGIEAFEVWNQVLDRAYGRRCFIPMEVDGTALYRKISGKYNK